MSTNNLNMSNKQDFELIDAANNYLSLCENIINEHTGEYMNEGFLTDYQNEGIEYAFNLYTDAYNIRVKKYGEYHYLTQYVLTLIGQKFISPIYSRYNEEYKEDQESIE